MTAGGTARVRRRAVLRLGVLAAVLVVAGLLPWVTAGPTAARLLALPLLVAGLGVTLVAARVRSLAPQLRPSADPVERRCAGCVCGTGGGCAALARQSPVEG